jgi:hypothetical protein
MITYSVMVNMMNAVKNRLFNLRWKLEHATYKDDIDFIMEQIDHYEKILDSVNDPLSLLYQDPSKDDEEIFDGNKHLLSNKKRNRKG